MVDYISSNVSVANGDADGNYAWCRIKAGGSGVNKSTFNEALVKTLHVTDSLDAGGIPMAGGFHYFIKQATPTAMQLRNVADVIAFASANEYGLQVSKDYNAPNQPLIRKTADLLTFTIPAYVGANIPISSLMFKVKLDISIDVDVGGEDRTLTISLTRDSVGGGAVPPNQNTVILLTNAIHMNHQTTVNTEFVVPAFATPTPAADVVYSVRVDCSVAGPFASGISGTVEIVPF